MPVIDIFGAVEGTDLGSVRCVDQVVDSAKKHLPRGSDRRPGPDFNHAVFLIGLIGGLLFAIVPGLPADRGELSVVARSVRHYRRTACGACGNRLVSVPHAHPHQRARLTGSIMCMGVATANSILVVSFATEEMHVAPTPLKRP